MTGLSLTYERLREVLTYYPETGEFWWRYPAKGRKSYRRVGAINTPGYRIIGIDGGKYLASRLAYLWMTGEWPEGHMDHINCQRADDRWCNLRVATRAQNQANQPRQINNTSGYKGVFWYKAYGRWMAQITVKRKKHFLGYFDDPKEAHEAYAAAAQRFHGEFARVD